MHIFYEYIWKSVYCPVRTVNAANKYRSRTAELFAFT